MDDTPAILIEPMRPTDWPDVRRIYEEGIATGDATLESAAPDWHAWDQAHRPEGRLVARSAPDGDVVGWAAMSPYSSRAVYAGVAWESVYVAETARGRGVGRALLTALIERGEGAGVWTLIAGIQAENAASLAVHRRVGFREVGVHRALGRDPTGRWRDVLILERRRAE